MSRVTIQGNPSGTGIFTIASPNSNTNQTLTLPDASGTLLTNSGTEPGAFSTLSVAGNNISSVNSVGFRNRIINGDMRIDQRNNGASVNATDGLYTLDRWRCGASANSVFSVQRSTLAPAGFTNSMLLTSLSATSLVATSNFEMFQYIEGFNVADLAWGTASAQPITVSFWVRSSLTGTFGGAINNSAFNRSYPFSYTINAANTWEQKSVTIAGDTSGTWLTDNGIGLILCICIGAGTTRSGTAGSWSGSWFASATGATSVVGTNGATFYITGVQLEAGSVATPFERRPYGTELALCQRYYAVVGSPDGGNGFAVIGSGRVGGPTAASIRFSLPATPRATPSASVLSATYALWEGTTNRSVGALSIYSFSSDGCEGDLATSSATTGAFVQLRGNAAGPSNKPAIAFNMEL